LIWVKGYPDCGRFASEKATVSRRFRTVHGKSATGRLTPATGPASMPLRNGRRLACAAPSIAGDRNAVFGRLDFSGLLKALLVPGMDFASCDLGRLRDARGKAIEINAFVHIH
jgi:hypothetical protein